MKKVLCSLLVLSLFTAIAQAQHLSDPDGDQLRQTLNPPSLLSPSGILGELSVLPAGDAVEGDYIGEMKFTRDGEQVWILNRTTDNITVIDWDTKEIIQNIPVGDMPMDIDFSNDLAVVACYSSNEVYFIHLNDFSLAGIATTSALPAKVHVSRTGNIAVVGCEESDVAEVFDLNTLTNTLTIPDFPIYLYKFSFITSNPRNSVYFSNFRITPDEAYVVNGSDEDGLKFWDLTTGAVTATVPEAANSGQIEISLDGSTVIAMKAGTPGVVTQVDLATQSYLKQMTLTDVSLYSTYSPPAVNVDGTKVLVPTNPGNTTLLDFTAETWQHVATGNAPDWVGTNADGSLFIAGDYYIAVVNPETGNILSSLFGISIQNGAVGTGNRIVASDPLRYESLVFYDFANPNALSLDGESATGSELEADATYSVKFTPDGSKLLAVNALSGTLSVLDIEAEQLEAIIPLGSAETYHADVTSDGKYALVAKRLENKVAVIDLTTNQVVANVPSGGDRPDQVFVLPGDQFAYALNAGGADNIGVIKIDGATSGLLTTFPTGNTGISWTNYGIRSDLKFTSDGYALLATPFSEQIQLLDLTLHKVVANLPMPGFPLQIAITEDEFLGHVAAVTLKNSHALAIFTGATNFWDGGTTHPCGQNPTRVDFDPLARAFWVTSNDENTIQPFPLETFELGNEIAYTGLTPIAIRFDQNGRRFTLLRSSDTDAQPHKIEVAYGLNVFTYGLTALPIHNFDISSDGTLVAIPHPGTDEVTLLKEEALGYKQVVVSMKEELYQLYPNPASEALHFKLKEGSGPFNEIVFRLFDANAKVLSTQNCSGSSFRIERQPSWPAGSYFYEISLLGERVQSGTVILQ